MRLVTVSAVVLLCLLGCYSMSRRPAGAMPIVADEIGDEHAMQREVERYLSVGMPLQKACSILKQHGFTCSNPKSDPPGVLCEASESASSSITYHARVWLFYDLKGTVTKIEAHGDVTGL